MSDHVASPDAAFSLQAYIILRRPISLSQKLPVRGEDLDPSLIPIGPIRPSTPIGSSIDSAVFPQYIMVVTNDLATNERTGVRQTDRPTDRRHKHIS